MLQLVSPHIFETGSGPDSCRQHRGVARDAFLCGSELTSTVEKAEVPCVPDDVEVYHWKYEGRQVISFSKVSFT